MTLIFPASVCTFRSRLSRVRSLTASVGTVALSLSLSLPTLAAPTTTPIDSGAAQRLNQMFSPDIQEVLNSCATEGSVNLSAGADQDGSVICQDGTRSSPVRFNEYVNTVSDFLAGSFLIGVYGALKSYSGVQTEMITSYLTTPDGESSLREALSNAIATSGLVPSESPQSVNTLTDKVMQRSLPILQDTNQFNNLLGTTEEYKKVAQNFCKAPGMSVTEAKNLVPNLDAAQLYAICVQESGLSKEVQQQIEQTDP